MELTLYTDETGFTALRDEWNDLLRRSRFDTIFLTWEWQTTWWRTLGATRGPLFLLALREADGLNRRLVGIVPLYFSQYDRPNTLHVVGCLEVADYLDLIIEAGCEEAVYAAFLDWLGGPTAPAWEWVDLCNQPARSLSHTILPELARSRGWSAEVTQEDVCPVITLPAAATEPGFDGWEAYLATLDKKERHEIRRKLRRIEREAPESGVRYVRGQAGLAEEINTFIALHRLSRRDKDAFMDDQMQGFFHAIAATLAEHGWLQLSFLEVAGQPIASYFCFEYKNEVQVYNSGFDPQAYPQFSPGWVLLARLIEDAIRQGRARFDFLQGDEDYKHRFGGLDEPVYRTLIRRNDER
ncbi:MAG: Acetyltransf 6 protein [Chloroflexota bacterium]|nr:Acetyltransf 6 protein [Chloroflexota bacterium]